jgi:hypothetical protein
MKNISCATSYIISIFLLRFASVNTGKHPKHAHIRSEGMYMLSRTLEDVAPSFRTIPAQVYMNKALKESDPFTPKITLPGSMFTKTHS